MIISSMKQVLIAICALLLITNDAVAQSDHSGPDDTTFTRFNNTINKRNSIYTGSLIQEFTATTTDGNPFNNSSLRNKVTLLVFWFPGCNCFNFKELDSVANAFNGARDFQIVAMGADTADFTLYKQTHYMPYLYVTVSSYSELHNLNYHNGLPSIFIINREGIIVKIKAGVDHDYAKPFIAILREQLL